MSQRIEGAFGTDPKNYPAKVREECTPKAIDAKHKIESIQAPDVYDPVLKGYAKSLADLSTAFDSWSKVAPTHLAEREVGAKVGNFGAAWHAFAGGKPGNDVVAYDRFLHCAVPGVDKMKDGQALVEFLFKQCKDAKYLDHLQNECGKEVTTEGALLLPTSGFKAAVTKLPGRRPRALGVRRLSAQEPQDEAKRRLRRGWPRLAGVHGSRPKDPRSRQGSSQR